MELFLRVFSGQFSVNFPDKISRGLDQGFGIRPYREGDQTRDLGSRPDWGVGDHTRDFGIEEP